MKAFKLNIFMRGLLVCLISLQSAAAFGQLSYKQIGPFQSASVENINLEKLNNALSVTENVQARSLLTKYLNKALSYLREMHEPTDKIQIAPKIVSTQYVYLFLQFPELQTIFNNYVNSTKDGESKQKLAQFVTQFQKWIDQNQQNSDKFKFAKPDEPLMLSQANHDTAFDDINVYINHPYYNDATNPSLGVHPADNLQEQMIQFIDGAKLNIYLNVFEFGLPEVAKALVRARDRGVSVTVGVDKNYNSPLKYKPETGKGQTYQILSAAAKGDHFTFTEINPVSLNHSKIIIRDAGTSEGASLFSSANFTSNDAQAGGDLADMPEDIRPTRSIPNSNHLIIIKSPLIALVTYYELRKTLILKYRGNQFPNSGSYVFEGALDSDTQKKDFVMLTFSPNGAMGNLNRDVINRVIKRSSGPIWGMFFSFSSMDLMDGLEFRARKDISEGKNFDFKSMGDTITSVADWSGFLRLSGILRQKDGFFIDTTKEQDTSLRSMLDDSLFQKIQSQIRVNPDMYGDFSEQVGDKKYYVSVKLHHKSLGFPALDWAFMGKSFNDSDGAENNQEQLLFVGGKVTRKLYAGFNYLYDLSPLSIKQFTDQRNIRLMDEINRKKEKDLKKLNKIETKKAS